MKQAEKKARKTVTVHEALSEYRYAIAGLAPETQRWYVGRVAHFADWCEEKQLPVGRLNQRHIGMYLEELRQPSRRTGQPMETYTVHRYMEVIRTFLYWCAQPLQRYCSVQLPRAVRLPRALQKVIQPFSGEQVKALQLAIEKDPYPIMVARNKAILAVLFDTGIRAGEVCRLQLRKVWMTHKKTS